MSRSFAILVRLGVIASAVAVLLTLLGEVHAQRPQRSSRLANPMAVAAATMR